MPSHQPERGGSPVQEPGPKTERYAAWLLAAAALIYALLAGLHTLQDFDLGWQLASGRWLLQHRQIFSTDVFSYTANGAPWIYPVLSGIAFYLNYLATRHDRISRAWVPAHDGSDSVFCSTHLRYVQRRDGDFRLLVPDGKVMRFFAASRGRTRDVVESPRESAATAGGRRAALASRKAVGGRRKRFSPPNGPPRNHAASGTFDRGQRADGNRAIRFGSRRR